MKIYVHTDIEGCAGYVFYAQMDMSKAEVRAFNARMNALLTNEVVAACEAALESGASEVYVNDAHGPCYNIDFERLPAGCRIINGRAGHFDAWLSMLDESFDAMICIGQHAMAGTPHSVCPHSLWHVNDDLKLSETTMAAAMAGCKGVPTIMVSGDDKICAEVREKIPGVHAAVVKRAIAAQNACSLAPVEACELIRETVRAAIADRGNIPPYVVPGPLRLNISNRNPAERLIPQDVEGDEIWETAHRALNQTYAHFGEDPIDDRSFRWP